MQIKEMLNDDSAVSPVIGVILMVAITVILAAVIAAFVLGLGPGDQAPQAQFDLEGGDESVTLTHSTGDKIDPGPMTIQVDGQEIEGEQMVDTDSRIASGDSVTIGPDNAGNAIDPGTHTVSVIYDMGDSSSTIFEEDVTVN